jgi:hypothetical protein
MRRTYSYAVVALVLLLAGADTAYWRIAADRLRGGWQAWAAEQRAQGWTVEAGEVAIGGWPWAALVTVPGPVLRHAGSDIPGDVTWRAGSLLLSVELLKPTALRISVAGQQEISIGDLPALRVTADAMSFAVRLLANGGAVVDLHGEALRVESADGAWHAAGRSVDGHAEMTGASSDPASRAITFQVHAESVALPEFIKWPLGPAVSSLQASGKLNGPLPAVHGITAWADAWRDGGGSLDVRRLAVSWGPLTLTSSATLALDDQLQPMGSGSAKISGYAETLDRLGAAGVLTKSAATVAKAVLSLLAGTGGGDAPSSVDVPLTLQYRTLSMRQVPLARLPELDWPAR